MDDLTSFEQIRDWLHSFVDFERRGFRRHFADAVNLDTIRELLRRLDDPQERFPSLHLAGTKGKGSTAALCEAALRAAGYRTGLYTSPHLLTMRERIRLDGAPVSEERLVELVRQVRPAAESLRDRGDLNPPTFFEIDRAPAELYGLTKLLGETMCRYTTANYGLSTIVLRPGGIVRAESYSPHNGAYLRGGVDVRDVVSAHVLALEAPETLGHQVFNITADSPLCRADPSEFRRDPVGTLESVAPGARALVEAGELQVTADMEWYSIAAAQAELGYRPQYGFQVS